MLHVDNPTPCFIVVVVVVVGVVVAVAVLPLLPLPPPRNHPRRGGGYYGLGGEGNTIIKQYQTYTLGVQNQTKNGLPDDPCKGFRIAMCRVWSTWTSWVYIYIYIYIIYIYNIYIYLVFFTTMQNDIIYQ